MWGGGRTAARAVARVVLPEEVGPERARRMGVGGGLGGMVGGWGGGGWWGWVWGGVALGDFDGAGG